MRLGVLLLALILAPCAGLAGPATRLVITDQLCVVSVCPGTLPPPPGPRTGKIHVFVVFAVDDDGHLDPSFTGKIAFSSTDAIATLPAPQTFTGTDYVQLIFQTPGSQTLEASETTGVPPLAPARITVAVVASPAIPALRMTSFFIGGNVVGIANGADGNLWYTWTGGCCIGIPVFSGIGRLTPSGEKTEWSIGRTPIGGIAPGFRGDLWFAAGDFLTGRIGRSTTSGAITFVDPPVVPSGPVELAAGTDSAVWFTDRFDWIGRVDANGAIRMFSTITPHGKPHGIAAGAIDDLWFTEPDANRVGRATVREGVVEFPLPGKDRQPTEIAMGPDGAFWFTEAGASQLGRITTSGFIQEFAILNGGKATAIATGPDRALWFSKTDVLARAFPDPVTSVPAVQEFSTLLGGLTYLPAPGPILAGADGNLWHGYGASLVRVEILPCPPGPELCLDGRFRARVDWRDSDGLVHSATAVPQTVNTGHFWFFSPGNVELVVKLVDGRAAGGHYWVFAGSLTNLEFTLTIRDTYTGAERTYRNTAGQLASIADTSAFTGR